MTEPRVSIRPNVNDYYEGDRVELECVASGNPTPTISWQRGANQPLPVSAEQVDELFIIESAREEDSGEYRYCDCIKMLNYFFAECGQIFCDI